jgi:hypothetical protein
LVRRNKAIILLSGILPSMLLGLMHVNVLCMFIHSFFFLQQQYMVSMVYYTDEIVGVLHELSNVLEKPLLFLLHGLNTDSNNFSKPAEFEVLHSNPLALTISHAYLI